MLAAYAWWTVGAVVLAFVDIAVHRLPHRLVVATSVGFLALLGLAGDADSLRRAVAAGAVLAVFFTVLTVTARGQLGWGDVVVAFPVGAALGWHSWTAVYAGTLLSLGAAAASAVALLLARRLAPKAHIPLGPYLLAGGLAATVIF